MSNTDVKNAAIVVEKFLNKMKKKTSMKSIENMMDAIDNVHTKSKARDMRRAETSKTFRSAAIALVKIIVETQVDASEIPHNAATVGKLHKFLLSLGTVFA
jgi:hypothetical protein